jgi:hypothetical protein
MLESWYKTKEKSIAWINKSLMSEKFLYTMFFAQAIAGSVSDAPVPLSLLPGRHGMRAVEGYQGRYTPPYRCALPQPKNS